MQSRIKEQLLKALWENVNYWNEQQDLTEYDKLVGVVFATLCAIDGAGKPYINFRLVADDKETGEQVSIECLHDDFYSKDIEEKY